MSRRPRRPGLAHRRPGRGLPLALAAALACAPTVPPPGGGATTEATAAPFVPAAVHVVRAGEVLAYLVRPDEVLVVTFPFRQAPTRGRGSTEAFAVGGPGVLAVRVTGPRAHEIVPPLTGPALTGWERLRTDTATAGRFTATPVWRPSADVDGRVLDSVALAVERLVFPRLGAVRTAPTVRPVLVPPP